MIVCTPARPPPWSSQRYPKTTISEKRHLMSDIGYRFSDVVVVRYRSQINWSSLPSDDRLHAGSAPPWSSQRYPITTISEKRHPMSDIGYRFSDIVVVRYRSQFNWSSKPRSPPHTPSSDHTQRPARSRSPRQARPRDPRSRATTSPAPPHHRTATAHRTRRPGTH